MNETEINVPSSVYNLQALMEKVENSAGGRIRKAETAGTLN